MDRDVYHDATSSDEEFTELHFHVFNDSLKDIESFIRTHKSDVHKLSAQDRHGNTPLHLACMLGRVETAATLIKAGALVKVRNKQMWTPLNEAISYGDRDLSRSS
jgi:ankyrin repeat protein